jgi:NAD(P)-dependent dehydrogenase (short-subunit alcohol dehydrogenase family)
MATSTPKVALVTGASSGIGKATALALNSSGYTVYATARRTHRLAELEASGIHVMALDVSDEQSMSGVVRTILQQTGSIDVLVNNAGYGSYGSLEEVPMQEARRQIEVNVFGLARMMQLVIPAMRQAGGGAIINIASVGGHFGEPFGAWYHASKYALEGLGDSTRMELKPFNIKVVTIDPGLIKTEWNGIAADSLLAVSGEGPYKAAARKKARGLNDAYKTGIVSPPEVVAKAIVNILGKSNPAFRYAVGGGAKPLLFFRKLLGDRLFYALLNR